MTIGEVRQQIVPMLEDTNWAERQMEREDCQYTRRAYVRSVFAMIEGTLWVLKQTVLNAPAASDGKKPFTLAEYALLSETTFHLKNNGEPTETPKFLRLPDNIRFTFAVISKYFGRELEVGVRTSSWQDFLASHAVRNRITHPKNPGEFEVTDAEILVCKRTTAWFYRLVLAVFDSFSRS